MSPDNPYQPHRTPGETLAANVAKLEALQRVQSEVLNRLLATPWTPAQRSRVEAALFPPVGYGSVAIPYYQPPADEADAAFLRSLGIAP